MNKLVQDHIENTLNHLYINPLEKCNLKCKICYTKKTNSILTEQEILSFVEKYQKEHEIQTITFCGGEVFGLTYFTHLVNILVKKGVFIQIITNGTINKLSELKNPNSINLIVSIDGLEKYHDLNRGKGNFNKSKLFLIEAQKKNFHTEIFSIVTKQNYLQIQNFETFCHNNFGNIQITYHPRKPMNYLSHHPVSNIIGQIKNFDFLNKNELNNLYKTNKVFPPKELGCYQIALMSDGKIFACCEGITSIGAIDDPISDIINQFIKKVSGPCLGCTQSEFMCGLIKT
ncbi:MAG: radical SAM protein [bacterium]|nr:radical SAM protein [bacterium]